VQHILWVLQQWDDSNLCSDWRCTVEFVLSDSSGSRSAYCICGGTCEERIHSDSRMQSEDQLEAEREHGDQLHLDHLRGSLLLRIVVLDPDLAAMHSWNRIRSWFVLLGWHVHSLGRTKCFPDSGSSDGDSDCDSVGDLDG
jgi:hypothetical protein